MSEHASNVYLTCGQHSSRPNPALHNLRPEQYVGSFVKLRFATVNDVVDAEHLWLEVIGTRPDNRLVGRVDNTPVAQVQVALNDEVVFEITDIEDMISASGEKR